MPRMRILTKQEQEDFDFPPVLNRADRKQGVSAYTLMDERSFLWHSLVFSATGRESTYVINGLMRNDVVRSDIHSTDTHGYSEAIFGTTHLLGFSYAPRIKNLKKQSLYLFRSRKKEGRSDWPITYLCLEEPRIQLFHFFLKTLISCS